MKSTGPRYQQLLFECKCQCCGYCIVRLSAIYWSLRVVTSPMCLLLLTSATNVSLLRADRVFYGRELIPVPEQRDITVRLRTRACILFPICDALSACLMANVQMRRNSLEISDSGIYSYGCSILPWTPNMSMRIQQQQSTIVSCLHEFVHQHQYLML